MYSTPLSLSYANGLDVVPARVFGDSKEVYDLYSCLEAANESEVQM